MNSSPATHAFAKFLREARLKADVTQLTIAEALGLSTAQFISNWERGMSRPPTASLRALARVLGVPPREMEKQFVAVLEDDFKRKVTKVRRSLH